MLRVFVLAICLLVFCNACGIQRPTCTVCSKIYENDGCVGNPNGIDGNATCPNVTVIYKLGPLSDGFGNASTCSIDVACPTGSVPFYLYPDASNSSADGNLVATCSEEVGDWYQQESTNEVINVFCRNT